jgi:hypothetical protein
MVSGQPTSRTPSTNDEMSLGVCIRRARGCVLKNKSEDGVVGDLAAKGVPGGEDFVAGGFAGLSGD